MASHLPAGPLGGLAAVALVAAFALLWAVVEIIASAVDVSVEQLVWTRYGTHLLVLLLVFRRHVWSSLVQTKRPLVQAGRSLLMLGMPLCFVAAVRFMDIPDDLATFWVVLLTVLAVPGSPQRLPRLVAGAAGYVGVLLVLHPAGTLVGMGIVFALAMGACFAGYLCLTDVLSSEGMAANLFHSALWVFAALSLRMPFVWKSPSMLAWAAMAAIGILGLLSLYTLDLAIRTGGTAAFIPAMFLQPVFARLCSSGFGGFGFRAELGTAVILTATIVAAIATPAWPRVRENARV